jgi:hypothetical protein
MRKAAIRGGCVRGNLRRKDLTVAKLIAVLGGLTAAIALVLGASPANASLILGGSCPGATQAFARFGDARLYTFGTNGGLESGSTGWSLSSGASVVRGNESYYVHSTSDSHSLSLPAGATALTPSMCMGTTSTVVRFFVKGATRVRVDVVERNLLGFVVGLVNATTVTGTSAWQPSPTVLNLDSLQGVLGCSSVQLRFTALDGTAGIDDVYVDPWSSGN